MKWYEFEQSVYYTSDIMINRIILDSILETVGDDYVEEGQVYLQ